MQEGLTALFFVSYVLVVGVVLMNIVVAVLLDEFISTVAREKQETLREEEQRGHAHNEPHSVPRDPRPETLHPTPYTQNPTPSYSSSHLAHHSPDSPYNLHPTPQNLQP